MFQHVFGGHDKLVSRVRISVAFSALLSLALSPSAFSQAASAGKREPAAMQLVETAISRLGGGGEITNLQDLSVTGTCTLAESPEGLTTNFTWIVSGREFRYEADGGNILVSGHGRSALSEAGVNQSVPASSAEAQKPYFAPALLLFQEFSDPQYSVESLEPSSNVENLVEIGRVGAPGVFQRWHFDPSSGLPTQVDYRSPSVTAPSIGRYVSIVVSKYKPFDGILFPTEISTLRGASLERKCAVSEIRLDTHPADSTFDLSLDGGY
ncbi:MAG: hypothetical protein WBQ94_11080 [Terracidiphilus sp.]